MTNNPEADQVDLMKEWMPIESAPTDGTIVLLAWKNTMKHFIYCNEKIPDWDMEVGPYCIHGSNGARSWHGQATHWQQLPAPPKSKDQS